MHTITLNVFLGWGVGPCFYPVGRALKLIAMVAASEILFADSAFGWGVVLSCSVGCVFIHWATRRSPIRIFRLV